MLVFGCEDEERIYKGPGILRMGKNLANWKSILGGRAEMLRQTHRIGNARYWGNAYRLSLAGNRLLVGDQ